MKRVSTDRTRDAVRGYDFLGHYVDDLPSVLDLDAIRAGGRADRRRPAGRRGVEYWGAIAERHRLDLTVVNPRVDPQWAFMTLDTDGKIRMDCSSPNAMASLIGAKDAYDISTGNDADADRHGIVTPDAGLMNPNHYLAVAIGYLFAHRPGVGGAGRRRQDAGVVVDDRPGGGRPRPRAARGAGRASSGSCPGLLDGTVGFGGEESAGASFLRHDGTVWTTDKDGILLALLASEIQAVTGRSPSQHHAELAERFGAPRTPGSTPPPTASRRRSWRSCRPTDVTATELAGEPITATLTEAPGNGASIGGLKVTTESAWFAARPSGTEDVYKIYAESFRGPDHLAAGAGRRPRGRLGGAVVTG